MDTTTTARSPLSAIAGWHHLAQTVDHLADVVESLLQGHEEFVCSLDFDEAEALAEVLDAGHRTGTAARLMHRWALTEPDWDEDAEHSETLREWLMLSVDVDRLAALSR
ncbi:hypothetical protein [Microbacterium sp. SS28]|uniref:hypothetical protein n=1 Tax=Microbacterium sp. SS28 TaxID=2919948 RepID=UPI001FAA388C|nr:hypothetical protein [Microbacterium sp. SS28]